MLSRFAGSNAVRASMLKPLATVDVAARDFGAKKKKKPKTNPEEPTDYETIDEPVAAATPTYQSQPAANNGNEPWKRFDATLNLDKELFKPFSLGDIKAVQSAPDNKPPSADDTIAGRYAGVLFSTASSQNALFTVYEDMMYLQELYKHSEVFRQFTENAGVGLAEITKLNAALRETASFHDITFHFLTVLAENKRLIFIKDISNLYKRLYQQFNREEKITIISAEDLSESQRSEVVAALEANPQNAGKAFTIEY